MLFRICSALSLDDDSPNGEGSMLRYLLGEEADGATGTHLRRLGEVGLISGSKSMVLFRVAPHAMAFKRKQFQPAVWSFIARVVFQEVKVPSSQLRANCWSTDSVPAS